MDNVNIKITSKYNNYTIKEFLKANHIGRGRVEEIRVKKSALVNNEVKPLEYVLKENDILTFIIDEKVDFLSDDKKLDIVYEDDYLLIVNKEANMLVHPDSKNKRGTLVNIVANYYNKNNIKRNIRYIHRIDKETTGIVIFAKDFLSEAILINENESFLIEKIYLALVSGYFKEKEGKIEFNNCNNNGSITLDAYAPYYIGGIISNQGSSKIPTFTNSGVSSKITIVEKMDNLNPASVALVYGAHIRNENPTAQKNVETVNTDKASCTLNGQEITKKYC